LGGSVDLRDSIFDDAEVRERTDSIVSVGEIQLGVEYSRRLCCGANFVSQALWEGQIWSGSGGLTNLVNNDVGLVGMSFNIGLKR
jgi:hypothetical protein